MAVDTTWGCAARAGPRFCESYSDETGGKFFPTDRRDLDEKHSAIDSPNLVAIIYA